MYTAKPKYAFEERCSGGDRRVLHTLRAAELDFKCFACGHRFQAQEVVYSNDGGATHSCKRCVSEARHSQGKGEFVLLGNAEGVQAELCALEAQAPAEVEAHDGKMDAGEICRRGDALLKKLGGETGRMVLNPRAPERAIDKRRRHKVAVDLELRASERQARLMERGKALVEVGMITPPVAPRRAAAAARPEPKANDPVCVPPPSAPAVEAKETPAGTAAASLDVETKEEGKAMGKWGAEARARQLERKALKAAANKSSGEGRGPSKPTTSVTQRAHIEKNLDALTSSAEPPTLDEVLDAVVVVKRMSAEQREKFLRLVAA